MSEFSTLFQQGNVWFFAPSAILLGVLYGLELGHSKTTIAAFIIAIEGTVKQAVALGLAAMLSHTAVVWLIALGGMYISKASTARAIEPWLQFVSAIIILETAFRVFRQTWQGEQNWLAQTHHDHDHEHHHHHDHDDHYHDHGDDHHHHRYHHHHHHHREHEYNRDHTALTGLTEGLKEYQDVRKRAHVTDIQRRFTGKEVTNGQILLFSLTGGLIPCPAAVIVLLTCIQLRAFTLGATTVLCFSLGLALTLVAASVGAVVSMQQAARRWNGSNTTARKTPYLSSALTVMASLYMGVYGYMGIVG